MAYGFPELFTVRLGRKTAQRALVEQAINLGFRGIDTACQPKHYNEAGVGDGLAACQERGIERSELYLQSKFTPLTGQDPERVPYDAKASLGEQVANSFQTSLKNLQKTEEVWQAMEHIFDNRGVKQLGISNCYDLQQLKLLFQNAKVKPAVIQNRFYDKTQYDHNIRDFCQQQRIIFQSFWTLTANPKILAHSTLQTLAGKYHRSAAQVFFRYLNQINIIPLTGTTSETHMREDLAIIDFELTAEECHAVGILL